MESKNKVAAPKLPPDFYSALEDIVGKDNVTQEIAILETYSKYSVDISGYLKKHAKDPSNIPACVVLPSTTEEVQSIVRLSNRHKIPFVPFTNGQLGIANCPTTPQPTLFIHFSRMNKILELDANKMMARIQAYVDYAQLQADAMKVGLWNGGRRWSGAGESAGIGRNRRGPRPACIWRKPDHPALDRQRRTPA